MSRYHDAHNNVFTPGIIIGDACTCRSAQGISEGTPAGAALKNEPEDISNLNSTRWPPLIVRLF